ncbi:MAG: helix-turn-helix transcriptional regulator [Pyrinomonadaceae bacterium]
MGRERAKQPERLASKLRAIRLHLGWTQEEMAKALGKYDLKIYRGYVGLYEIGERIPTILILLAYSRIAKIPLEVVVDDELELPKEFYTFQ